MYLNKAFVVGNLTRDPELKALPSGMSVTSFSVATNRVWKDKEGAKKEEVDFHNIVVFGKQAESSAQYLKKGSQVLIEGRMQTRSWDGPDGQKRYRTEIVADQVTFGAKRSISEVQDTQEQTNTSEGVDAPADEINPQDIPF
jgi:single-strand DNA-binding protein